MILPVGASSFKEAMKMGVEVYHNLKVIALIILNSISSLFFQCLDAITFFLISLSVCHQEEVWTRCY